MTTSRTTSRTTSGTTSGTPATTLDTPPAPPSTATAPVNSLEDFHQHLRDSLAGGHLSSLLLSKYRGAESTLQRISIRPLLLKNDQVLSFLHRHQTKDITSNYNITEGLKTIQALLGTDFKSAYLTSTDGAALQVEFSKKGKLTISKHKTTQATEKQLPHDRQKKRFVDMQRPFLVQLGVTDHQHKVIPAMSRKWKQINKFIEVFSQSLETSALARQATLQVVDFGSGKGYLTFALHDYLTHGLQLKPRVTGVELRQELVDLSNVTAASLDHQGLDFVCGDVKTHAPARTDVMVALHACDTATDYAIHYGIRAAASIIMCSPCCHKQIRPQLHSPALLQPMLQYGVHLGQQAEMVTDSLRALLLEAYGYTTRVFEFVSLEHTDKNKMILAVRNSHYNGQPDASVMAQISAIKTFYGIREHCLETLLAAG
ncbi:MAG: SAM-dependent methyltransferase [Pseudomonadales bacterium]|jgi:protein-L-isoaspartate O-methyltransferase|nr:SAM-dependent methyltransferase [Pseudomonadales bacterium]MDP4910336.1 SAM-dependent methyltransferase [Pseudomonadales bacterium]